MAVQNHGFFWEHELLVNVYRVDPYELKKVGHTSPFDGPAHLNRLTGIDMSIKTTGNSGTICLGDCLRIYEDVSSGKPYHMTVLHYKQDDATKTKNVMWITEIELTSSIQLMFGDLTREDISSLFRRNVVQQRKNTQQSTIPRNSCRHALGSSHSTLSVTALRVASNVQSVDSSS